MIASDLALTADLPSRSMPACRSRPAAYISLMCRAAAALMLTLADGAPTWAQAAGEMSIAEVEAAEAAKRRAAAAEAARPQMAPTAALPATAAAAAAATETAGTAETASAPTAGAAPAFSRRVVLPTGPHAAASALVFLREQPLLVTAHASELQLWDWQRRLNLGSLPGHAGPLTALALSPDGQQLASVAADGQLRLWSTRDGHSGEPAGTGVASPQALAYSADGQLLAVGGRDGTAVFNLATGRGLHLLPSGGATALQFSPDGQRLAVQGPAGWRLWAMDTGRAAGSLVANAQGVPVALSPTLQQALRSDGRHLSLVSLADDSVVARTASPGVTRAVFSGDGRHVAWVQADGRALRWQLEGGVPQMLAPLVAAGTAQPDEPPPALGFSADGELLAAAGADATLRLWAPQGQPQGSLTATGLAVHELAFSPDGSALALGMADDSVALLDLPSGQLQALRGRPGAAAQRPAMDTNPNAAAAAAGADRRGRQPLAFAPDGRSLATAWGGQLRLVNRATGVVSFTLGAAQALDLRFSRDGAWLFVLEAGQLQVWDLALRYKLQTLPLSPEVLTAQGLALDASGQQLLLWTEGGEPRRVQLEARAITAQGLGAPQRRALPGMPAQLATRQAWTAALSPDGQHLALRLGTGDTVVYALDGGRELLRLVQPLPAGVQLQFARAGRELMAWGAGLPGHAVLRWAVPGGQPLPTLMGHHGQVRNVVASADDRWLASTADDQTVRLWSAADGRLKAQLKLLGEPSGWVAMDDSGGFDASTPEAEAQLLLRTGQGLAEHTPLGAARGDFHRPGLLKRALATDP